jgi:hypothetical protein
MYLNEKITSSILPLENLNTNLKFPINNEIYTLNILQHFHYVYLVVSLVFIIRLIININSFYRYIRPLKKHKKDGLNYIESEETGSPFSFMKNIVYNPKQFSTTELKDILNHEKEHSLQRHSYDIILMEIYKAINWLNPVAWLYKKSIVQNLEFLADTKAIKKADNRVNYQNTMLKLSIPSSKILLVNNFYDHLIKKRITLINSNKSKKLNLMKSLVVVPAIITFFLLFNTKTVAQNYSDDKSIIVIEKVEGSVAQTVDKLVESTPGYGKDSNPLYLVDYILQNRQTILDLPNNQVVAIAIIKKEYIEERYGKGAVESGVVQIITNRGQKPVVQGHKIK